MDWKGRSILSWDIGTNNMCFCLLDYSNEYEFDIKVWENMNLESDDIKSSVDRLIKELDRRQWMLEIDHIAVESQTKPNVSTKVLSHVLQTYFSTKTYFSVKNMNYEEGDDLYIIPPNFHFVSAISKFRASKKKYTNTFKNKSKGNKAMAIQMATDIMIESGLDDELAYFRSHDKKDDLADSFLQALSVGRDIISGKRGKEPVMILNEADRVSCPEQKSLVWVKGPFVGYDEARKYTNISE